MRIEPGKLKVGDVVKLKRACLGCDDGAIGVVYETYPDYDFDTGYAASIIFQRCIPSSI